MVFVNCATGIAGRRRQPFAEVGSALAAENAATATAMTGVVPAAADEVSLVTAAKFATHGQTFQALSAQAAAMHERFVATMRTSAASYAITEVATTPPRPDDPLKDDP